MSYEGTCSIHNIACHTNASPGAIVVMKQLEIIFNIPSERLELGVSTRLRVYAMGMDPESISGSFNRVSLVDLG